MSKAARFSSIIAALDLCMRVINGDDYIVFTHGPPLESAILDDPLSSLDDINLLGLIDLLRRTKDQRQLFVSTHEMQAPSQTALDNGDI
jgi:hypothetical protein